MVNSTKHMNLSLIIIFFILLVTNDTVKSQSTIQPESPLASPTILWDVSSIAVIVGAIIATLILIFILSLFLRRITNPSMAELSKRELSIGINPQILKSFPILSYSFIINHLKERETEAPLQCAVCLADFNNNDTIRMLPQCNHFFHPPCIDAWLSNHPTCPVCRTNLNLNHQCSCHFAISIDTQVNGERRNESV
ncbi:E3 ubiquitin-protein ligase ATL6 [Trifolium repens]|nr:E3 ubiquitin-protein ligase ATL6 [Trifolium repens]